MYTWSWDDIGYPVEIETTEICHTISHGYGAGYSASRAGAQRMQKLFTMVYPAMTSANWLALVEFWRSVYGSADAFYWEFPMALYGSPVYGSVAGEESADGFDADYDTGYGGGPAFTVRFAEDRLPQKVRAQHPGKWAVTVPIIEVA